jgi:hypothetical protein
MASIELRIGSDSDWFTVEISAGNAAFDPTTFVIPAPPAWPQPHAPLVAFNKARCDAKLIEVGRADPGNHVPLDCTVTVESTSDRIVLTIGHGNVGTVRVISPADDTTADKVDNTGQNRFPYPLLLWK